MNWLSLVACACVVASVDAAPETQRDYGRIKLLPTLANGSGSIGSSGIAVNGFGSAYVAGNFSGPGNFHFGVTNFHFDKVFPSGNGFFLARYNGNGDCVWVRHTPAGFGGAIAAQGTSVLQAANIQEPASDQQRSGMLSRQYSGIITLVDESGNCVWKRQIGGARPTRIATSDNGTFVVVGELRGSARFESVELKNETPADLFLAKYSREGQLIWAKRGGGPAFARGVALDSSGNVYVTGSFSGKAAFAQVVLTENNHGDAFLAKYDSTGTLLWVRHPGGSAWLSGVNVAIDAAGNPHLVGLLNGGKRVFGTAPVSNESPFNNNVFYAKYTANGDFEFVRQFRKGDFDFQNIVVIPLHLLGRPLGMKPSQHAGLAAKGGTHSITRLLEASQEASALERSKADVAVPARLTWRLEDSTLVLIWPTSLSGFVLESSTSIASPTEWSIVPIPAQVSGERTTVRIELKQAHPFYRLAKPQVAP